MTLNLESAMIPQLRRRRTVHLKPGGAGMIAGLVLAALFLFVSHTFAADGGKVVLNSTIEKEVVVKDKEGREQLKRVSATGEKNVPGDEIIITVLYENRGRGISKEVVINNPVPEGTAYKGNSAEGKDSLITFSADGGRTFEKEGEVKILGSSGKLRTATPEEITHVKWTIEKELKPTEKGKVSFRAIIKQ